MVKDDEILSGNDIVKFGSDSSYADKIQNIFKVLKMRNTLEEQFCASETTEIPSPLDAIRKQVEG
jgi:hypothetical protein